MLTEQPGPCFRAKFPNFMAKKDCQTIQSTALSTEQPGKVLGHFWLKELRSGSKVIPTTTLAKDFPAEKLLWFRRLELRSNPKRISSSEIPHFMVQHVAKLTFAVLQENGFACGIQVQMPWWKVPAIIAVNI